MTDKKKKYLEAIKHLEMAKALLTEIKNVDPSHFDGDAANFAANISTILSHDNDECGIIPFFKKLN